MAEKIAQMPEVEAYHFVSKRRGAQSKGEWLPVTERKETFRIKGKKPVEATVLETRHGPLLNSALQKLPFPPEMPVQPLPITSDYGIALSWAVEKTAPTFRAFYDAGKARNVAERSLAARAVQAFYLNLVYADRDSIAWQVTGSFPLRGKGKGMLPSPGWTGEYDWTGFLDPESRPSVLDPAEGFIATANNRTVPRDFPHQLTSSWYHPDRRDRIAQVLEKTEQGRPGEHAEAPGGAVFAHGGKGADTALFRTPAWEADDDRLTAGPMKGRRPGRLNR